MPETFRIAWLGYARHQVDDYLHQLSTGTLPARAPTFDLVRRGYDCRRVDEYLAQEWPELGARSSATGPES